jgi:small-conductance mechanosensitive channel
LAEAAKKLIILGIALGAFLAASGRIVAFFTIDPQYARYIQIAAIIVVGYFAVSVLSTAAFKIASRQSEQTAKTVRSLNRILGAIIIIAIVISYLSQDPVVAISLSTVTGIVVGFAAQNLIGNLIAGMYLVIARPFRVGDRVNAFNQWGILSSVDLLYCKIIMDNGDVMLAPNTGMVTTNVIVHRDSVPS